MLFASLLDHILNIEGPAFARIQLTNADFHFRTEAGESIEAIKQFTPELLLRSIR